MSVTAIVIGSGLSFRKLGLDGLIKTKIRHNKWFETGEEWHVVFSSFLLRLEVSEKNIRFFTLLSFVNSLLKVYSRLKLPFFGRVKFLTFSLVLISSISFVFPNYKVLILRSGLSFRMLGLGGLIKPKMRHNKWLETDEEWHVVFSSFLLRLEVSEKDIRLFTRLSLENNLLKIYSRFKVLFFGLVQLLTFSLVLLSSISFVFLNYLSLDNWIRFGSD